MEGGSGGAGFAWGERYSRVQKAMGWRARRTGLYQQKHSVMVFEDEEVVVFDGLSSS